MISLLQINNWGIKKLIRIVVSIQLAMLVLVGLSALGFDIPVIRQIIGFLCLTFIPGLLILRIFKLDKLGSIETILYSVGLSIAFTMFLGFFINMIYPLIGISKPISIYPVIATITFVVLILCVIAYIRNKPEAESPTSPPHTLWRELFSPPALFLFLLPILSILGTQLVYLHQGNIMLLILLFLIAFTAVLVAFGRFIPSRLYPLAVVSISIALLWHWSLISSQLTGGDIFLEYGTQRVVLDNSIWDSSISSSLNAMLSIVILAPVYSLMLNLDTVWLFKVVYPIFFCLVPLALFQAYRKQIDNKVAFLAVFFFMSFPPFFSHIVVMPRMEVAELFLALSVLLLLDKEMNTTKRAALLIIFGFSIVVSHYSISYLYMLYLLIALSLLFLWRNDTVRRMGTSLATRFTKFRHSQSITRQSSKLVTKPLSPCTVTGTYVILFIVLCLTWYMWVSSGSPFDSMVRMGDHVYSSLATEFLSPGAVDAHIIQAFGLMPMRGVEIEWEIARIFQYITQFFIVIGIIGLIANWRKTRFYPEYAAMSLVSMVILALAVFLPYFTKYLHMMRIYHTTLLFLAPFCVLGGITVFHRLLRLLSLHHLRRISTSTHLKMVVLLVLIPYFLFSTGFIFEMSGATATSMPLSLYEADWRFYPETDIHACQWIARSAEPSLVHTDRYGGGILAYVLGVHAGGGPLPEHLSQGEYIFLRYWNVKHGQFIGRERIDLRGEESLAILRDKSKIYTNGLSEILGP